MARDRPAFLGSLREWRTSMGAGFMGAFASAGFFTAFALTPAANVRTLALIELPLVALFSGRLTGRAMAPHELAREALELLSSPLAEPPGAEQQLRLERTRDLVRLLLRQRPDPASRSQPEGVHGPTEITDPAFPWDDALWRGLPLRDYVFYELHVGTFTPEGTFDAVIPRLPDLNAGGAHTSVFAFVPVAWVLLTAVLVAAGFEQAVRVVEGRPQHLTAR